MHKRSNRISFLAVSLVIALSSVICSCSSTLYVAPKKVDCNGVADQKCYLVRGSTTDNWILHDKDIEGLDYEPGFSYMLKVKRENVKNAPFGGSSLKYTLVEVLEKRDVTDDIEIEDLVGKEWKLEQLRSDGVLYEMDENVPSMNFAVDGKVTGNTGCNNYFADFTVRGRTLHFSEIGSTRKACEEAMELEAAFLKVLDNDLRALFSEGRLILSGDGGNRMILGFE